MNPADFCSGMFAYSCERDYICLYNKKLKMEETEVVISVLTVQGLVQGVGFRPFVYRIASEMGICGEVENRNDGVSIRAVVTPQQREQLIGRIRNEHPRVASVLRISVSEVIVPTNPYRDFRIVPSRYGSDEVTQVAPDIAVCPACLRDREQQPYRLRYPFINCTHCGPRFSIIRDLPYDRSRTTMSAFPMCAKCRREYMDVANRRFHAEPIACNHCGPSYYTLYNRKTVTNYSVLLSLTSRLLREGEVIAVRGIGGYHLVCDATNEAAVSRLRKIKQRDGKPFAVMFGDLSGVRRFADLGRTEEECLLSWRRPIVLLKQLRPLAASVNPGMRTLGCMLPYMPIHFDWFGQPEISALVVTSGNPGDCPITIAPKEAGREFGGKVALLLHHDRAIHNRVDDSVLQVCGGQPCLIRRSRGYVPEPFFTDMPVEGILGFGAEKTNTFALGKGDSILQSQYIGDLKNWETFCFYTESLERFQRLFRFSPSLLACDLHPDYLSSREAERLSSERNLPLVRVQHHHAHAAACMLEYGLHEPVIALVLDGTGLGDDGKVWGGEIFLCDRSRYERLSHLEYIPLPGGDKASKEPWRMAVACLWHYFGEEMPFPPGFVERIGEERILLLRKMMEKGINTPYTSSAGRLFDAVASLLGVCDVSTYQAEAPVRLEQAASGEHPYRYSVSIEEEVISMRPLLEGLLADLHAGLPASELSVRFHNTFAWLLLEKAKLYRKRTGADKVVVSGGCFQNKRLTERLQTLFAAESIPLYVPGRIPCNDGGIAVGQLAVAASLRMEAK